MDKLLGECSKWIEMFTPQVPHVAHGFGLLDRPWGWRACMGLVTAAVVCLRRGLKESLFLLIFEEMPVLIHEPRRVRIEVATGMFSPQA